VLSAHLHVIGVILQTPCPMVDPEPACGAHKEVRQAVSTNRALAQEPGDGGRQIDGRREGCWIRQNFRRLQPQLFRIPRTKCCQPPLCSAAISCDSDSLRLAFSDFAPCSSSPKILETVRRLGRLGSCTPIRLRCISSPCFEAYSFSQLVAPGGCTSKHAKIFPSARSSHSGAPSMRSSSCSSILESFVHASFT
jgi:hypothetical protein